MIDRQHGCIVVECDTCDETIEGNRNEQWPEFWPKAKAQGWSSKQHGMNGNATYTHHCPSCNR